MALLRRIILKRFSLIFLFSAIAFCAFQSYSESFYSVAQTVQQLHPQQSPLLSQPLGVKITSHTTGQKVPTGELTISGTSTDTPNTECQVYSDWNDQKPFGNAVAAGPGGPNDYSEWTFTYTSAYHLVKNGTNNLTSKISCTDGPASNITKWNSVNVTGIDGLTLSQQSSITSGTE